MRIPVRIPVRTVALAIVIVCVLTLGACGNGAETPIPTPSTPLGATITLGASSFQQANVSLSAGQALRLVDPAGAGGTHMLCLGKDGQCDVNPQGPDALHGSGLKVAPGDTKDIIFLSPGQFQVTCTIHPSMNLAISVLGTG